MTIKKIPESLIKLFGMHNLMLETALDKVERDYEFDLGRASHMKKEVEEQYYLQFDLSVRNEAASMARHYEVFYCLEKSIRQIIKETLEEVHGIDWWEQHVPKAIQDDVENNIKREIDNALTPRSVEPLDYTTFGQLGEIIRHNWADFDDMFNSQKALTNTMTRLNALRGPIAHCCQLAEDEILRLQLSVRDWFRLME